MSNRNNYAPKRSYQTRQSPYHLNEKEIKETMSPTPKQAVEEKAAQPKRQNKRKPTFVPDKRDADPNRRILKDRLENEYVVRFYRRSKWQILYLGGFPLVLLIFAILILVVSLFLPIISIFAIVLLVADALWWVWTLIDWSNDYLIITNLRFIYSETELFTSQLRTIIRVSEFTEVKVEAKRGSLEYAFQIGTVIVQGKNGTITFNRIAKPLKVYHEIDKDFKDYRAMHRKERDTMMDKYFMAKAHNQPPPRPTYTVDIPYIRDDDLKFTAKIRKALPVLSETSGKRLIWHKHVIILYRSELIPLFFAILYILAWIFLLPLLGALNAIFVPVSIVALLIAGFAEFVFIWYRYELWNNDVYTLSTEELIDSEKLPFGFNEFKDRIKLNNVQDIKFDKNGFFANIFNYGNVMVDRIGGNKPLTFKQVPHPDEIQQQINKWVRTRHEIIESLEDERQIDFLLRHRRNLRHVLEDE